MARIKFSEDPFTWIGVKTWPVTSYHHVAKARGIGVVIGIVAVAAWVVL